MVIAVLLFTSCANNNSVTRGSGSSNKYATRDVEIVMGSEQTYPRIALVIGNNDYQKNKKLTNAVPDARAVRDFLNGRGFKVFYAEDADKNRMKNKVNEFMGGLGKKSVAVIYYAGHASQDKSRDTGITTNYLVPINDSSLTSITDYDRDAISMNYILNKADELNHGINIAMLDACRTPIGRGGNIQNIGAEGVYLVYSTASGTTASDSGAFRRSFLKYAEQPLKLTDIFEKVKLDLRKEGQRPSIQNEIVGMFYFTQASKPTPIVKPRIVERIIYEAKPTISRLKPIINKTKISLRGNHNCKKGDLLNFIIDTNGIEGYMYIYYVDSKNRIELLFPNKQTPLTEMGGTFLFPRDFGNFNIKLTKDCQDCEIERAFVYLLLTKEPINLSSTKKKDKRVVIL